MNEVKVPRESKLIKVMFEYYNDYVKEISLRETKPNYIPICFTKEYLSDLEKQAKNLTTPYYEMFHAWERDVRNTYGKDKGKYLSLDERVIMYLTFNYYFGCFSDN